MSLPNNTIGINNKPLLIDTHCHLDMSAYKNDLNEVIQTAQRKGIDKIITIGIDLDSSIKAVEIAALYQNVFATVGVHPHEASNCDNDTLVKLELLAESENVVGYGEIGLDYVKKHSPPNIQRHIFQKQLTLAKKLDLPVVIHDREAHEDTLTILKTLAPFPQGGVMHCFSGDINFAHQIIEMGFLISIPGVVTFKNAKSLQEVVKEIDLKHMLVETDGPFLAPVPFRGKRNTPDNVEYIANKISEIKNLPLIEVAKSTTENAINLFKLDSLSTY